MSGWWLVSYVVLWVLLAVVAVVNLAVLRQMGLLWIRVGGALGALTTPGGPEIGDPIPLTSIGDRHGVVRSLFADGTPLKMLVFVSPSCVVCDSLIPVVPSFAKSMKKQAELFVLLLGEDKDGKFDKWGMNAPPVAVEPALQDLFGLPTTPYGLVVDEAGRVVAKGLVNDVIQMESLLNEALQEVPVEPHAHEHTISSTIPVKG